MLYMTLLHFAFLINSIFCQTMTSLFQHIANRMLSNDESKSISSTTLLRCTMACTKECLAIVYDKENGGECKLYYQLSFSEMKFSTSFNSGLETWIKRPCQLSPSICLNGGVCRRNMTSSKGYNCQCEKKWKGEKCEERKKITIYLEFFIIMSLKNAKILKGNLSFRRDTFFFKLYKNNIENE